jgi:HSP20 family protein
MAEDRPQAGPPFFEAQQEVRRLFQELVRQPWGGMSLAETSGWQPCCDMVETDKEIIVEVELPGLEREDVQVEVQGEFLRITGERRATVEHRGRHYHRTERQYGRFERQLRLPLTVDREAIQASFRSGILTITLPKKAQK